MYCPMPDIIPDGYEHLGALDDLVVGVGFGVESLVEGPIHHEPLGSD